MTQQSGLGEASRAPLQAGGNAAAAARRRGGWIWLVPGGGLLAYGDSTEPSGLGARAIGLVRYRDDSVGEFEATLVREQGRWKLWNVNIVISPERLEEYQKRSGGAPNGP
jgi:hypothetical protein